MRTEIRLHARPGVLPHIRATGGMAARRTGPDTVHLIGTAATPLGGDELHITVEVDPGARLVVRSVAATLALPGPRTAKSMAHWVFHIGPGGMLDFDPEPTIVAGGAWHESLTTVRLASDACLRLRERVQIGRAGEDAGRWCGELNADLGGTPLLRHRLEIGAGGPGDDDLAAPRALISELTYPCGAPPGTAGLQSAILPLAAGGTLYTWTGRNLAPASAIRSTRPLESQAG